MKKNILVMNEKMEISTEKQRYKKKKRANPGHLAQKVIFSMFKLELPYY